MKTLLCYGDSNTWGDPPGDTGERYPWDIRWPGVLQRLLGTEYRIIEEGLGGRTTFFDDPDCANRNGFTYLPVVLETHAPLDLLIIMLGTNDLKTRFNLTALAIAQGAAKLLSIAKEFEPTVSKILLISPPHVTATNNVDNTQSFEGGIKKSQELAKHYQLFASECGCHFFDAATVARSSPVDGIHLDEKGHLLLAEGLAKEIKKIFNQL